MQINLPSNSLKPGFHGDSAISEESRAYVGGYAKVIGVDKEWEGKGGDALFKSAYLFPIKEPVVRS